MDAEQPRERRRVLRVGLDEQLPDPAHAERVGMDLARQLHDRVAAERQTARALRDYLTEL